MLALWNYVNVSISMVFFSLFILNYRVTTFTCSCYLYVILLYVLEIFMSFNNVASCFSVEHFYFTPLVVFDFRCKSLFDGRVNRIVWLYKKKTKFNAPQNKTKWKSSHFWWVNVLFNFNDATFATANLLPPKKYRFRQHYKTLFHSLVHIIIWVAR